MAAYFPKTYLIFDKPKTQEEIQAQVDSMTALAFNSCIVSHLYGVVSDMFLAFYEPPCGLPTPNGMMALALARRLARENAVNTEYDEKLYAEQANSKVVEAEEGMLLDQD
jgi:hypothetical protein